MVQNYQNQFRVQQSLYASTGTRILNFIVDYLMQIGIVFMLTSGLGLFCEFTDNYDLCYSWDSMNALEEYLLGVLVLFVYYTSFEMYFAQSPAKFLTQTIVVDEFGNKPSNKSILIRSLSRIVPFDGLSFLGGQPGWHDRWADTFVVDKKELEAQKQSFYSLEEIGQTESRF